MIGIWGLVSRTPDGVERPAAVNIGRRPTYGQDTLTLEAHILDFEGDLYGAPLRVAFVERLRDERKFPDPEALVAQIRADIAQARRILEP